MKQVKNKCDGASCFLCSRCLKDWIPAVEANKSTFQYKKGELLFREGDLVTGIYFVYSGTVKVHKKWGDDKELIVRFAKGGDIVGHRGLGKDMHYPIAATALELVTVCFIPLDFFWTTIKVNQDFTERLLLFYAEELQESERKMRNLAHMQVKGRIAYALLLLKDKFGVSKEGVLNLELSRQDFASYVGAAYETVFRVMNELIEDKIINVSGRNITINDTKKLSSMLRL